MEGIPDALSERVTRVQISAGVALAGFILNAGLVVLLIAYISDSVLVSLGALGVIVVIVTGTALYADVFHIRATGARPLRDGEFPWLRPMVEELSASAGVPAPEIFVADQEHMNAFATGMGRRAKVVFFSKLLHDLSKNEVQAVAGHEVGHIVNRDTALAIWTWAVFFWVIAAVIAAQLLTRFIFEFSKQLFKAFDDMPFGQIFGLILGSMGFVLGAMLWALAQAWAFFARLMQLSMFRQREFLADATSVALVGEGDSLAGALVAIESGPPMERGEGTVSSFCIGSKLSEGWFEALLSTHPSTEQRIAELDKLPAGQGPFPAQEWKGTGQIAAIFPAGSLAAIVLIAFMVPFCTNGSRDTGGSYQQAAQPRSEPVGFVEPTPLSGPPGVLGVSTTPEPRATPRPTTGELLLELRYADGAPVLNSRVSLYVQEQDINGAPIVGGLVTDASSGSSGLVSFEVTTGRYVGVFNDIAGPRLRPDLDQPGLTNLEVQVGETTSVRVDLSRIVLEPILGRCTIGVEGSCVELGRTATYIELCAEEVARLGTERHRAGCASNREESVIVLDLLPGRYTLHLNYGAFGSDIANNLALRAAAPHQLECVVWKFVDKYGDGVSGDRQPACRPRS